MSLIERAAEKALQAQKKSAQTANADEHQAPTASGDMIAGPEAATATPAVPSGSLIDRAAARSKEEAAIRAGADDTASNASPVDAAQPPSHIQNTAGDTLSESGARKETAIEASQTTSLPTDAEGTPTKAPRKRKKNAPVEEVDVRALRRAGYITPDAPPSLMSEEMRLIKRTLLLNAFGKGRKKIEDGNLILITSSNPGEGKTFFSLNLALSIALEKDVTVLLVDADFSKPEVLNRLGISGGKGLLDVVAEKSLDISDCLVRTSLPNLVVLPAGRQHHQATELLASERMASIMREIGTRYPDRVIIFDSPPVLASSAASVLALYMGQAVFVIEAEKTTEPQIKESLNIISGCPHISLMLNKSRFETSHKKFASYYGYGGR